MPIMDGIETARHVRGSAPYTEHQRRISKRRTPKIMPCNRQVGIILFSTLVRDGALQMGNKSVKLPDVDAYVEKPFHCSKEFAETVEKVLHEHDEAPAPARIDSHSNCGASDNSDVSAQYEADITPAKRATAATLGSSSKANRDQTIQPDISTQKQYPSLPGVDGATETNTNNLDTTSGRPLAILRGDGLGSDDAQLLAAVESDRAPSTTQHTPRPPARVVLPDMGRDHLPQGQKFPNLVFRQRHRPPPPDPEVVKSRWIRFDQLPADLACLSFDKAQQHHDQRPTSNSTTFWSHLSNALHSTFVAKPPNPSNSEGRHGKHSNLGTSEEGRQQHAQSLQHQLSASRFRASQVGVTARGEESSVSSPVDSAQLVKARLLGRGGETQTQLEGLVEGEGQREVRSERGKERIDSPRFFDFDSVAGIEDGSLDRAWEMFCQVCYHIPSPPPQPVYIDDDTLRRLLRLFASVSPFRFTNESRSSPSSTDGPRFDPNRVISVWIQLRDREAQISLEDFEAAVVGYMRLKQWDQVVLLYEHMPDFLGQEAIGCGREGIEFDERERWVRWSRHIYAAMLATSRQGKSDAVLGMFADLERMAEGGAVGSYSANKKRRSEGTPSQAQTGSEPWRPTSRILQSISSVFINRIEGQDVVGAGVGLSDEGSGVAATKAAGSAALTNPKIWELVITTHLFQRNGTRAAFRLFEKMGAKGLSMPARLRGMMIAFLVGTSRSSGDSDRIRKFIRDHHMGSILLDEQLCTILGLDVDVTPEGPSRDAEGGDGRMGGASISLGGESVELEQPPLRSLVRNPSFRTSMIRAFCALGMPETAEQLLEWMKTDPNMLAYNGQNITGAYVDIIDSYARQRQDWEHVDLLFADYLSLNLSPQYALGLYTVMLSVHQSRGNLDKVLELFGAMQGKGMEPDQYAFNILIRALVFHMRFREARQVYESMISGSPVTMSALMQRRESTGCNMISTSSAITRTMKQASPIIIHPNLYILSTMMLSFCMSDQPDLAVRVLQHDFPYYDIIPDATPFTVLIDYFAKNGDMVEALRWYNRMLDAKVKPTVVTFNALIYGLLFTVMDPEAANELVEKMVRDSGGVGIGSFMSKQQDQSQSEVDVGAAGGVEIQKKRSRRHQHRQQQPDVWTYSMLFDFRVKRGDIPGAMKVFDDMVRHNIRPNSISMTSLINAYAEFRDLDAAMNVFQQMITAPSSMSGGYGGDVARTDAAVYDVLMKACLRVSKPSQALALFEKMILSGVVPDPEILNNVVRAHLRLRDFEGAVAIMLSAGGDARVFEAAREAWNADLSPEAGVELDNGSLGGERDNGNGESREEVEKDEGQTQLGSFQQRQDHILQRLRDLNIIAPPSVYDQFISSLVQRNTAESLSAAVSICRHMRSDLRIRPSRKAYMGLLKALIMRVDVAESDEVDVGTAQVVEVLEMMVMEDRYKVDLTTKAMMMHMLVTQRDGRALARVFDVISSSDRFEIPSEITAGGGGAGGRGYAGGERGRESLAAVALSGDSLFSRLRNDMEHFRDLIQAISEEGSSLTRGHDIGRQQVQSIGGSGVARLLGGRSGSGTSVDGTLSRQDPSSYESDLSQQSPSNSSPFSPPVQIAETWALFASSPRASALLSDEMTCAALELCGKTATMDGFHAERVMWNMIMDRRLRVVEKQEQQHRQPSERVARGTNGVETVNGKGKGIAENYDREGGQRAPVRVPTEDHVNDRVGKDSNRAMEVVGNEEGAVESADVGGTGWRGWSRRKKKMPWRAMLPVRQTQHERSIGETSLEDERSGSQLPSIMQSLASEGIADPSSLASADLLSASAERLLSSMPATSHIHLPTLGTFRSHVRVLVWWSQWNEVVRVSTIVLADAVAPAIPLHRPTSRKGSRLTPLSRSSSSLIPPSSTGAEAEVVEVSEQRRHHQFPPVTIAFEWTRVKDRKREIKDYVLAVVEVLRYRGFDQGAEETLAFWRDAL
ncbi:hypothetical protein HK102_004082, partial [Quaeritorhiza haematococci]